MLGEIELAWKNEPWSASGVVHSLAAAIDDEMRPLGEKRAPLEVREGVPFVEKRCPFRDERYGRWMNVSALTQMTSYLEESLEQIAGLRSHLESPPTWEGVSATLFSQLAGPAVYLLSERNMEAHIPARIAVGYKLAAGYTTPVRELLLAEARGERHEVSVAVLHGLVRARNHLVGARDVCAASNNLLDRVTSAFLAPPAPAPAPGVDLRLLAISCLMARQVQLGVCWELYDEAMEHRLLIEDIGRDRMTPRTEYVARILDERLEALPESPTRIEDIVLPRSLGEQQRAALREAMDWDHVSSPLRANAREHVLSLERDGVAAIRVEDRDAVDVIADRFAAYIAAYTAYARMYVELETEIRGLLRWEAAAEVKLVGGLLPPPRCLRWLELMSGCRMRFTPPPNSQLLLRAVYRELEIPSPLLQ